MLRSKKTMKINENVTDMPKKKFLITCHVVLYCTYFFLILNKENTEILCNHTKKDLTGHCRYHASIPATCSTCGKYVKTEDI